MPNLEILSHPHTVDQLDQLLAEQTDVDVILSTIPTLFGISRKASYLAYRSLGFSSSQALDVLGLGEVFLHEWRQDQRFLDFEYEHLPKMQKVVSTELIRLGFLRNMAMLMAKDSQIIIRASGSFDDLSEREFSYFRAVRKHYTPNDLLALEKAANPNASDRITIQLNWGDTQQIIEGVSSEVNNDNEQRLLQGH